jgi:hypothetical protein
MLYGVPALVGTAVATGANADKKLGEDAVATSRSEAPSNLKTRPRLRVVGLSRATTAAPAAAAAAPPPSLSPMVSPEEREEDDRVTVDFANGGSIANAGECHLHAACRHERVRSISAERCQHLARGMTAMRVGT